MLQSVPDKITQQIVTQHPLLSFLQSTTEMSGCGDIKVRDQTTFIRYVYLKCNNGYKERRTNVQV